MVCSSASIRIQSSRPGGDLNLNWSSAQRQPVCSTLDFDQVALNYTRKLSCLEPDWCISSKKVCPIVSSAKAVRYPQTLSSRVFPQRKTQDAKTLYFSHLPLQAQQFIYTHIQGRLSQRWNHPANNCCILQYHSASRFLPAQTVSSRRPHLTRIDDQRFTVSPIGI